MKKRILSSIILAMGIGSIAFAQTVQENELAVVYYMPQTQIAVTIDYQQVCIEPGPFYLYAERYLGVSNVATEAQTRYEVTDIRIAPHTVADHSRAHKVVAKSGNATQWLSLTPEGLLYGYNVPAYVAETPVVETTLPTPAPFVKPLPLMEEQMVAASIAKMAEGAAKQIYHIREMRMNLLAGDVEHTPADGQAMQLVLAEMDKREQMLVELFVGTRTVTPMTHTIYYVPEKDVTGCVIGRLSQFSGVVDADDLSGEPIRLTLVGEYQSYLPAEEKESKFNKSIPSQLYYNLPGSAHVMVEFADQLKVTATMPIAQFGVAVPLANNILLSKKKPQIYFNLQTGNILTIEKQ